jgi:hypothetical protein
MVSSNVLISLMRCALQGVLQRALEQVRPLAEEVGWLDGGCRCSGSRTTHCTRLDAGFGDHPGCWGQGELLLRDQKCVRN